MQQTTDRKEEIVKEKIRTGTETTDSTVENTAEMETAEKKDAGRENQYPKVSVVIPVYNVQKYLGRCLDSVIGQTLKEIEIIAVNDGSTDDSLVILREYEEKDSRIRIIDKPNSGYGNSMNRGIAAARGEYIGIVESDDFIAEDMYESLYALTREGTGDVVKGNFYDYYGGGTKPSKVVRNTERDSVKKMEEPFTLEENAQILWGHPSVWSAIYRRDFLTENSISFVEDHRGWEDNPFFHETLCRAESIFWTDKPLYYYRRDNPDSSSNSEKDLMLPFDRMQENFNVLEENHCTEPRIKWRSHARAFQYLDGVLASQKADTARQEIAEKAHEMMELMDAEVLRADFGWKDQITYHKYLSPIPRLSARAPKILIYNWLPFDNPWNWGGGVTIYCRNVLSEILKSRPDVNVYFLSSGFAYSADTDQIYYRKIPNIFGNKVRQYEIVNSPIPAEQRYMYVNPLAALENPELKQTVENFIEDFGPFEAIHFNNIEGLSLDVLDLKEKYPKTRFIFSIHNYVPMCVNGSYYMRHKHCNCDPSHTGEDCFRCTRADIRSEIAVGTYKRGTYGIEPQKCISQNRWIKRFGFERLDQDVSPDRILEFARTATAKLNQNCDEILAVSKRVYEIALGEGFDASKMKVSYIGTKVAERQLGHGAPHVTDGLKIVFLGGDINYEEKGYPFLLDALSGMDKKDASRIDLVLTVKQPEHAEIYAMLRQFRSLKVIQGYTHDDLKDIFEGCSLSIVPVLWEDNLPQIAIESAAYGVPVLASSAGGACELCDSELFRFECGSAKSLIERIKHFLNCPEDLQEYWTHHHGLVTMSEHWKELEKCYGLDQGNEPVVLTREEWKELLRENEFLYRFAAEREELLPNRVLEEQRQKIKIAQEESRQAREERDRLKAEMETMKGCYGGKVTFQTEYDPVHGATGVKLFRLILENFDFSDFYAEIKFVKLQNVSASASDILRISGTWHGDEGVRKIDIHQCEWIGKEQVLKDDIIAYIDENSVIFFGKHFGRACGYDYNVMTLTSRADHDSVKFERINQGFIQETEELPKNNIISYTVISNKPENNVPTVVAESEKKTFLSRLRGN